MISSNQTNFTDTNSTKTEAYFSITIIIQLCLSIQITLSNVLIVIIILFLIKKKTFSNIIFLLISLVDLFVGLVSIPGNVLLSLDRAHWPLPKILCIIYKTFDYSSSNLSLILLVIITVHRYKLLKDPHTHKEDMSKTKWIVAAFVLTFYYTIWFIIWCLYFHIQEARSVCYFSFNVYIYIFYICVTVVPFLFMIIINMRMIRLFVVLKRKKKQTRVESSHRKQDKAIYCILSITLNLILCWSSFMFLWPIAKVCATCFPKAFDYLFQVSNMLIYLFSGINPIILLYFNRNFRQVLMRKLFKQRQTRESFYASRTY
jgi:hypothetical protein